MMKITDAHRQVLKRLFLGEKLEWIAIQKPNGNGSYRKAKWSGMDVGISNRILLEMIDSKIVSEKKLNNETSIILITDLGIKELSPKKQISPESLLALQELDCNCNDCFYMSRDEKKYRSFDFLYTNSEGVVTEPSHRIQYGICGLKKVPVSFIPNTIQLSTQDCFVHRRKRDQ